MACRETIAARRRVLDRIRREKVNVRRFRKTPIRKKLVERVTQELKFPSAAALTNELKRRGYRCSKATTIRDLKALGTRPKAKGTAPYHTDEHRAARLRFCEWCTRQRKRGLRLIFSDETWVHGNDTSSACRKEWVRGRERTTPRRRMRNDPKVMLWLAFTGDGRRCMSAIPTDHGLTVDRPMMEQHVYTKNLRWLRSANAAGFVFQEDGAKVHSKKFLKHKRIKCLSIAWPALSPDLNVCEEYNSVFKRAIAQHQPYGHDEILAAAKDVVNRLPNGLYARLEELFWRKVAECIRVKGDVVKLGRKKRNKKG